jgi:NitT/TauT family transport system substrate-binding protein
MLIAWACAQPAGPASPSGPSPVDSANTARPSATSGPALTSLRIAYPSPGATQAPIWVAFERGLLREQGLDVELVFLSGTRTDQGVVSGETPIGFGVNVVPTRLSGADVLAIAGVITRMPFSLYARQGISTPQDLRGKTMVGTLPGASNTMATYLVLRRFGLEPGRDVFVQPTQGTAEQFTLLAQGLADAALLSPPASLKGDEVGLTRLATNAELNIPFMTTASGVMRAYAQAHPNIIDRFLRAYVNAVALARRDPASTKALIGKYSETDDAAILDETYSYFKDMWGQPDFRVPPESVESILRVLDVPGADTAQPQDFIDNHFVDELHNSGFIRQSGALN